MITGCSGFLGKELLSISKPECVLFPTNRQILDLTKQKQVENYIRDNKIDIILHAAIKGGRRTKEDQASDYYENILAFENLIRNLKHIKMFINYDSAASYDRSIGIDGCSESDFPRSVPIDFYGSSKYTIANRIRNLDKCYNLRIFNCFGVNETEDRMIKGNILKYIHKEQMIINYDKIMDFFFIDDLIKITEHYIKKCFDNRYSDLPQDINLCYNKKYRLSDITNFINKLSDYQVPVQIKTELRENFNYYGVSQEISKLNLDLVGLERGIMKMYQQINQKWRQNEN